MTSSPVWIIILSTLLSTLSAIIVAGISKFAFERRLNERLESYKYELAKELSEQSVLYPRNIEAIETLLKLFDGLEKRLKSILFISSEKHPIEEIIDKHQIEITEIINTIGEARVRFDPEIRNLLLEIERSVSRIFSNKMTTHFAMTDLIWLRKNGTMVEDPQVKKCQETLDRIKESDKQSYALIAAHKERLTLLFDRIRNFHIQTSNT